MMVFVGSVVSSTSSTITGHYGVSLDLTPTGVTPGAYGTGNQIPAFTVDQYGRLTLAAEGNTAVVVGMAIASSTLTGTYGSTINLIPVGVAGTYGGGRLLVQFTTDIYGRTTAASNGASAVLIGDNITSNAISGTYGGVITIRDTGVTPGTYGAPQLLQITVESDGRLTAAANGATPVLVNSSVGSNTGTITGLYGNTLDLPVQGALVPGVYGNSTNCLAQITITPYGTISNAGCLSIGGGSGNSSFSIFLGTPNEIIVTEINNATLQFSTPQPIAPSSSVTFAGVTVTGATANTVALFGASQQLQSLALSNGQLVMGSTGALPVAALPLGTANQIIVTPGPGSLTFSLAPAINVSSLVLSGIGADMVLFTNGSDIVQGLSLSDGQLIIGVTGGAPVAAALTGTPNEVIVALGAGSVTLSTPQPIATTSNVQFNSLILGGGTINATLYLDSNKNVASVVLLSGQVLIGSNGSAPVANYITGTPNEVLVASTAGAITLSTPQPIAPSSNVQFNALTLGGGVASSMIYLDASKNVASVAATNGQVLIGVTGSNPIVAAITGTAHEVIVTNGAGTITLSTPQPIDTTSSVTFAGVAITAFAGGKLLQSTGTSITESTIVPANVILTTTTLGGALAGNLPNPSLTTQVGVYPGSYGGNTSCIPMITVTQGGVISNVGCFSVAGTFEPSGTNNTFLGTPNEARAPPPRAFPLSLILGVRRSSSRKSTTRRCSLAPRSRLGSRAPPSSRPSSSAVSQPTRPCTWTAVRPCRASRSPTDSSSLATQAQYPLRTRSHRPRIKCSSRMARAPSRCRCRRASRRRALSSSARSPRLASVWARCPTARAPRPSKELPSSARARRGTRPTCQA